MTRQENFYKCIKEYKEYQLMEKSVKKQMDELKDKMIKMLAQAKVDEYQTDAGKCSYKEYTSNSFSQAEFAKEYKELFESFKRPKTTAKFLVS